MFMPMELQAVETPTTNEEQVQAAPNKNIPNINSSTKLLEFLRLPFEKFLQRLIDSPDVKTLYMFIDGIWMWLYDNQEMANMTFTDELLGKITSVMTYRSWKPVTKQYLDTYYRPTDYICNKFIDTLKKCNNLVKEGDVIVYSTVQYTGYRKLNRLSRKLNRLSSIQEIITPGTKIKFHFPNTSAKECTKVGQCGFMLNVTRDESGSFGIQLSTDPDEYPDDLHFHENLIFARNMHLVITRYSGMIFPLPWGEQLECDGTETYWRWGWTNFYMPTEIDECHWETQPWRGVCYSAAKFNFAVVYQ